MFKIQTKEYSLGKRWQDLRAAYHRNSFATEDAAWEYIASLDQDGYIDRGNFRVVPVK